MRARRAAAAVLGSALGALALGVAAQATYRLDRASTDGAGGGVSENVQYRLLLAFGQHDADQVASGGPYRWSGGVFAQVPTEAIFRDGFESD
ncbi:MAG: hypothetical protein KA911_02725 [Xanthomonadales bacterium]|nr:hypothetical protein [Xanthomonadales bacterium]MBP7417492.1 hypothetical protein [Xanthomonadales bacterium]HQW64489.1 hypothetical protein [Pseudomonadota bacterium]HQX23577.1 hypothetical protein [Pseudomonadota bacterium]